MKKYIAIFSIIFWAGLIAGISFLEAPLKFQAPGITIPLGLGIGQLVFQALNKVEIVLWIVILFCTFPAPLKNLKGLLIILISLSIIVDTVWLLPLLDERAKLVLAGNPPPDSIHHLIYAGIEGLKIISLCILGFLKLKELHNEK